jgi:asparagine synthase (glutamine-hydrolysing)
MLDELRLDWRAAYVLRFSGFMPRERIFLQPGLAPRAHYWRMPANKHRSPLETLLEIDRLNYLPEYILRKSDLCLMAHGVELRAPMLDHRFVASVLSLPMAERFTQPAKKALAPALAPLGDLDVFGGKKRGFNPPLGPWLETDLSTRIDGLAQRLEHVTSGQLARERVDRVLEAWRRGRKSLDEQVFQLLVLDESLAQLAQLARQH